MIIGIVDAVIGWIGRSSFMEKLAFFSLIIFGWGLFIIQSLRLDISQLTSKAEKLQIDLDLARITINQKTEALRQCSNNTLKLQEAEKSLREITEAALKDSREKSKKWYDESTKITRVTPTSSNQCEAAEILLNQYIPK